MNFSLIWPIAEFELLGLDRRGSRRVLLLGADAARDILGLGGVLVGLGNLSLLSGLDMTR
jgi:hypothetical protein